MLTLDSLNLDRHLATFLAVNFAERSLPVWEEKYPEDERPQKAIVAAKSWLKDPDEERADAVAEAGDAAAYAYAWAADAADAARATKAPAYAAWAAAYAAWAPDADDWAAAYAAADAARTATRALNISEKELVHEVISQNLGFILKYKLKKEQSFSEPELILEYLNEEGRNLLLFNLDILR